MRKILIISYLFVFVISGYSQDFKDLIVTKANDSIHCTITLLNDDNIFYDYKKKKNIENTFVPINKVKKYTYGGKSVTPTKKIISDSVLRKNKEEAKYLAWLNSLDLDYEHIKEVGPLEQMDYTWDSLKNYSDKKNINSQVKLDYENHYSYDSSYYVKQGLYPMNPYEKNPCEQLLLVRKNDSLACVLIKLDKDDFVQLVNWRSNSLVEIYGCTRVRYGRSENRTTGTTFVDDGIRFIPKVWKFDLDKKTVHKFQSKRRYQLK